MAEFVEACGWDSVNDLFTDDVAGVGLCAVLGDVAIPSFLDDVALCLGAVSGVWVRYIDGGVVGSTQGVALHVV